MHTDEIKELKVAHVKCKSSLLFHTRYFFVKQYGRKFVVNDHHKKVCEALDLVLRGKIVKLILNVAPRYSKCVSLRSMIMTERGLIRASDVLVGDIMFSHDNGRLIKKPCIGIEPARKESVRIKMKSGRIIECSHDHPMLTTFGYVNAEDIKPKERIKALCSIVDFENEINDAELDFATLMIFEGDCGSKNIRFSNNDKNIVSLFYQRADELGFSVKKYKSTKRADHCVMGGESGIASDILRKYNLKGHKCYTKRIPSEWFSLSLRQRLRFIDLMFATDGYVHQKTGQCGVTLANRGLIDDIQQMLSSVGVIGHVTYKPNKCAGAWGLTCGREQTVKLLKLITFMHKREKAELALNKFCRSSIDTYPVSIISKEKLTYKTSKPPFRCSSKKDITREKFDRLSLEFPELNKYKNQDFYLDEVVSVEKIGEIDLIHFEVKDSHNFICNGLVSHNTELAVKNFISLGLAINPKSKFIHLSYSDDLALDNSEGVKDIVNSEAYKQLFPEVKIKQGSDSKKKWYTTEGGGVYATSTAGQVTGFGAGKVEEDIEDDAFPDESDIFSGALVIDDAIKPEDAYSDVKRERINQRWESTIKNRVNSRRTPQIVMGQRTHQDDISGYLMKTDGFTHDIEEALADPSIWYVISLPALIDMGLPTERALWPFKHTLEELHKMREADSQVFDTQYQQNPTPKEGLMYTPFKTYSTLPVEPGIIKVYTDTADKGKDYLMQYVYKETQVGAYILDVLYTPLPMKDTEPMATVQICKWDVDIARIESNNGGEGFARAVEAGCRVMKNYKTKFLTFHQSANKEVRIFSNSAKVNNLVYFPEGWDKQWPLLYKHLTGYKKAGGNASDDPEDAITGIVEFFGVDNQSGRIAGSFGAAMRGGK